MLEMNDDIVLATNARRKAYAKYTEYTVGAVLLAKNGRRFTGCNIQNNGIQSYCAERVAFLKALSEGETDFERILIIGGPKGQEPEKCLPCGYCRQFMNEFVEPDFKIYTYYKNKIEGYTMEELLPNSFKI